MCVPTFRWVGGCVRACLWICTYSCKQRRLSYCLSQCVVVSVQGGNSSSSMTIHQLQWGPVRIVNTTLTCVAETQATPPPEVRLVAETAQQLQQGLELLGQLQPFTITLARDMAVPVDTWPRGLLVQVPMVLAGLPPPAPRTLRDLYQVRL